MTPTTPVQDLATQWNFARKLYPIYFELAREFAIDVKPCAELEAGVEMPGKEAVEQANQWLDHMDAAIQVHQLRQFLQTSSLVSQDGIAVLLQHFLGKSTKSDAIRDKVDFLLVQYFSQNAPAGLNDAEVDLAYVAQAMETVLGPIELKPPVWLNALDRVLDAARKCKSLDELLHGGVLEQGRKAKGLAGELFYLPVVFVAFTRFGYLMRRAFFRLMLGDLNLILDGLTELEDRGIETLDCRRAILRSGADHQAAYDLPVLEGDVPGGILFRITAAHAGRLARFGGARAGPRQSRGGRWQDETGCRETRSARETCGGTAEIGVSTSGQGSCPGQQTFIARSEGVGRLGWGNSKTRGCAHGEVQQTRLTTGGRS